MIVAALILAARLSDANANAAVRTAMDAGPNFVAVVYDRNADRSPRTIVCGVDRGFSPDKRSEICVAQVTPAGRVRIVQRRESGFSPHEIHLRDLVGDDRDEVIVDFHTATRNPASSVYRMRNERLQELGTIGTYWGFQAFDLDRDGVPELLDTGCCDQSRLCAVGIGIAYQRYERGRYRVDGKRYIDAFTLLLEEERVTVDQALSLPFLGERGRYVLHVFNGNGKFAPRVRKATIRDGDRVLLTMDADSDRVDVPVSFPRECHTLFVEAEGPPGSLIHFLLEEVSKKKK